MGQHAFLGFYYVQPFTGGCSHSRGRYFQHIYTGTIHGQNISEPIQIVPQRPNPLIHLNSLFYENDCGVHRPSDIPLIVLGHQRLGKVNKYAP